MEENSTQWLDRKFAEFPEFKERYAKLVPTFDPSKCAPPRFAESNEPDANRPIRVDVMFPDGDKRRFGVRTLVRYFILGDASATMPGQGCVAGCMNPHHAVFTSKGAKNDGRKPRNSSPSHKVDPMERALRQMKRALGEARA
jgi:hypothetical protein